MTEKKLRKKRGVSIAIFSILFLFASLWVGTALVSQQQNIKERAAVPACPGAEQCPVTADKTHLRSCHPGEADGSPSESLCAWVGRVETCGPNLTKWCCPAVNGIWTTDLTKCPSANVTPTPTASPSPSPSPTASPVPTASPSPTPTKSPSPSPSPIACSNPNINSNPWNVDQLNGVNIVDIGIIIDSYGKDRCLNPKTDVNNDGYIDIIDIGIVIDHYTF